MKEGKQTMAHQAVKDVEPQIDSPSGQGAISLSLNPTNSMIVSPDNGGKRIGILIVSYNAVTTIAKVLKRIPEDVWKNVEEVVIFDDASHDHTYELALGM